MNGERTAAYFSMEAVAIDNLENIMDNYRQRDIHFAFTGMKGSVRDLVSKAGWEEKYGERTKYLSIQHALKEIGLTG